MKRWMKMFAIAGLIICVWPIVALESTNATEQSPSARKLILQTDDHFRAALAAKPADDVKVEAKSRGKAFLFSLLIPGAGEYYLGKNTLAKSFFFTEVALWASYISFQTYSNWKRDDMYVIAATHANAEIGDKPSQYFVDLGNYQDIYEYNDAKQRSREFYQVYPIDTYYWSWDDAANQRKFEQLRIASDRAHNRSVFVIGGIIANHLVSAIDAVWQSNRLNKKLQQSGLSIHLCSIPQGNLLVTVTKSF